jgi:hypothetical protein
MDESLWIPACILWAGGRSTVVMILTGLEPVLSHACNILVAGIIWDISQRREVCSNPSGVRIQIGSNKVEKLIVTRWTV